MDAVAYNGCRRTSRPTHRRPHDGSPGPATEPDWGRLGRLAAEGRERIVLADLRRHCTTGRAAALVIQNRMLGGPALPTVDLAAARNRRLVATRLQEIEGNPLSAEDIATFEMFEREAWPHERRRA